MTKRPSRFDFAAFGERVENLLNSLQIPYNNGESYVLPFVHRSALNELDFLESNERLEYLGDAVLELFTTDFLFRKFPEKNEGELTDIRSALVRGRNLATIAESMKLQDLILLSRGEIQAGGNLNPYILANTFEALLGAIYLDAGFEAAKKLVENHVISTLDAILASSLHVDPKSNLQEITQALFGITPEYVVESETGFDHEKNYVVAVHMNSKKIGTGEGSSKKKASIEAAKNALENKAVWGG